MPEVHLPHLEDDDHDDAPVVEDPPPAARARAFRSKSLIKIGLEVLLISTGVFLGLMGEQWRENAHNRELAEQSLRRFREEIRVNRGEVSRKFRYHEPVQKALHAYLAADAKGREAIDIPLSAGISPPFFEHTAWDLALATQSLVYVDPELAFSLSRIYTTQGLANELGRVMTQAMYLNPPSGKGEPFLQALDLYYGDLVLVEPQLLKMYEAALPQIDRALQD